MLSKCWKSIPIPKLTRQSKIIIERITTNKKSFNPVPTIQLQLDLIPQIREDGYFALNQSLSSDGSATSLLNMKIDNYKCINDIQNVHVKLFDEIYKKDEIKHDLSDTLDNITNNDDEDYPYSSSLDDNIIEDPTNDIEFKIHLKGYIPYYTNLSCKLQNTNITVQNTHKIEADSHIHISTTNGTIQCYSNITSKSIKLITTNGTIHFPFNKLRAQLLYIFVKNGRIRGKLIHGGTFIHLLVKNNAAILSTPEEEDDTGAVIDINSIYSSSSSNHDNQQKQAAKLVVISPQINNIMRIKSNHGHLYLRQHITCTTPSNTTCNENDIKYNTSQENSNQQQSSIECNSINGSFNIKSYSYVPTDLPPSNIKLHVDSLSQSSKSTIQAIDTLTFLNIVLNQDNLSNNTNLRFLSQLSDPDYEDDTLGKLIHEDENSIVDDVFFNVDEDDDDRSTSIEEQDALITLPATNKSSSSSYILETKTVKNIPNINYYSGTFINNTTKSSSNTNSIGKINIQNTADTALQSFSSSSILDSTNNKDPSIVGHVYGFIKVDVLTWMDKIRSQFLKD